MTTSSDKTFLILRYLPVETTENYFASLPEPMLRYLFSHYSITRRYRYNGHPTAAGLVALYSNTNIFGRDGIWELEQILKQYIEEASDE